MCVSSRENEVAAEAWVETRPEHRRRGLARQVTAAWGHDLRRRGKIPFYSHRLENSASQAVARSLGLRQWKTEVAYS
jgi:predicted GNAT family acetyltransferase